MTPREFSSCPGRMRWRMSTPERRMSSSSMLIHAHLAEHLEYRRRGDLRVIRRVGIPRRGGGKGVFEVRHVYLHQPLEHAQGLHALVAGAVPDHGYAEVEAGERLGHGPGKVRGGDEADVVHARVPQPEHDLAQLRHGELHTAAGGYLSVLAVDAAEAAAGEEDGAAPSRAAYAGLLAVVRRRPRGAGEIGRAAAAEHAAFAHGSAVSRAVMAAAQKGSASLVWP